MTKIGKLEIEIKKIKERNKKVEADKAWETSKTRIIFIAVSTYILILIFLLLIDDSYAYLKALVSLLGYLISTATYGYIKKWWLKNR